MNRKSKTINLMKYIIIGLGNYGHVLAEELSALGHEVIAPTSVRPAWMA